MHVRACTHDGVHTDVLLAIDTRRVRTRQHSVQHGIRGKDNHPVEERLHNQKGRAGEWRELDFPAITICPSSI